MTVPSGGDHGDGWGAIVVALDASPLSLAGLRLAARLAQRLKVPVTAVCVEDSDIARLARHPGAVAICTLTARARPMALAPETIAAALAGQRRAARAAVEAVRQRLLEEAAAAADAETVADEPAPAPAEVAFLSRRGMVAREIRAVLADVAADLLVMGGIGQARARWQRTRGMRLGSTARALLAGAEARRVLVVRRALDDGRPPVFALWDGSAAAEQALRSACAVAAAAGTGVAVLAFGGDSAAAEDPRIGAIAASFGQTVRIQALPPLTVPRLVRATDFPQALLVLPDEASMTLGLSTPDLIDLLSCSVLLVR